jgi:hypothetical protein
MKTKSGGLGDNPLFFRPSNPPKSEPAAAAPEPVQQPELEAKPVVRAKDQSEKTIERIRSSVRTLGKEAATHRFTTTEKNAIADIVHGYKPEGIKTSENEITRIAINFIVEDHKKNGTSSVLDKVLKALHS